LSFSRKTSRREVASILLPRMGFLSPILPVVAGVEGNHPDNVVKCF
jgi:hypothetical protein